ncbi:Imm63 family immunity protein [Mycobacteroides abscessus]|uniref:Imm63 family immunity protein n=1 Tax=Mycobacteroides abscessus TaxID=36809 RepID=UPI000927AFB3|nr:hypothetical protein [Mycobacteroides abscessus]MDO3200612.1 hypothetical protein [Mycobacteroides abscessus subsp. abscessus]SHY20320.1 Uncharacterised protein [Mycobacteroides abscessus subsp. abscessus]SHY60712.1 Uncharacterised protein [Mycobacteroides abscessus subsp. abscessus]SIK85326.1 Uncharacterised protein [Mycobacteroides abscessus subsp. abscessus]SLC91103.1 Uncharacterised protein [Mycobacteroides abscessus subsp. abscessus]
MDDKARALQSEIDQLSETLGVDTIPVGLRTNDGLNIYVDDAGAYHYTFFERGKLSFDRVGDLNDVLYWYCGGIVFSMASRSTGNRKDLFYVEYEILSQLNPEWGKRRVRETAAMFRNGQPQDIALLPDIGEDL